MQITNNRIIQRPTSSSTNSEYTAQSLWAGVLKCRNNDIETIRQVNTILVLNILRKADRLLSRPAIADLLGLSKVTVANIIKDLVDMDLVVEAGMGTPDSRGGRKPQLMALNKEKKRVLGARLGPGLVDLSIRDITGHELKRVILKTEKQENGDNRLLSTAIKDILVETNTLRESVLGLVAAVADNQWGANRSGPNGLSQEKSALSIDLRKVFGFPVRLVNLTKARAFGEAWFNHNPQEANFFYLNLSHGLTGLGIRQSLFDETSSGFGASYLIPLPYGEEDRQLATLESRLNGNALLADAAAVFGGPADGEALIAQAAQGEEKVLNLYRLYGYDLGCAISQIVHLTGLDKFVLGGFLSKARPYFEAAMRQAVKRHVPEYLGEIAVKTLRPDLESGVMGATALALDRWVFHTDLLLSQHPCN